MKLQINGNETNVSRSMTIRELLVEVKATDPDMVSVELNGRILRREEFDTIRIAEGDAVEFLYFMGGGAVR